MYLHRLRLIEEEFCADLFADDLSTNVVLLCQAESHLLQDELHLLIALHGTKCLHLVQRGRGGDGDIRKTLCVNPHT